MGNTSVTTPRKEEGGDMLRRRAVTRSIGQPHEHQRELITLSKWAVDNRRHADDTKDEAKELLSRLRLKGYSLNMALDIAFFRRVMGQFATGVTIVTTRSQTGIAALTVNSFTSVSLDPLLVLVCVDLRSHSLPTFREGGVFAVNILTQEQEALSNRFATSSPDRYEYLQRERHYLAATGSPILADTLGFIDARIVAEYPGGDHVIFLGQVEAMGYHGHALFMPGIGSENSTLPPATGHNGHQEAVQPATSPLLYYSGKYYHLSNRYQHQHPDLSATTSQSHEH